MKFRWKIVLANLDPVIGSEQGKTRPVLVISEEKINEILPVVNVLPITSRKPGRTIYPNEVFLKKGIGGLKSDSIVLCHQIRTLDKKRLIKVLGTVSQKELQEEILEKPLFSTWDCTLRKSIYATVYPY